MGYPLRTGWHGVHSDFPVVVATKPAVHAAHVSMELLLYSPASHATQASLVIVGSWP